MDTESQQDFSFKRLFVPLSTSKAIHWFLIIGLVVYFVTFFNGFVWDDNPQYVQNPIMHSLFNIPQIITQDTLYYRPFPAIIFTALYMLVGATAFWYHLFQVVLHITNTILIFLLFKKYISRVTSFILSLVFLIHPINVESVAYISSMQINLSLFFDLVALFIITNKKLIPVYKYSLVFLCLLLSIFSKETGWFFFILIPSFMFLHKTRFHRKDYFLFAAVCILIALIYWDLIAIVYHHSGSTITPIPIARTALLIRLITLPKIIFYYFITFLFPKNLGVSQQWLIKNFTFQDFFLPLIIDSIIFIGIALEGYNLYRNKSSHCNAYYFFMLWFFLTFSVAWQIIPLDMTVADRWFYVPMIGLLGMIGIFVDQFKNIIYRYKIFILTFTMVLLSIYAIRTVTRVENWKDGLTLFSHDITVSGQSYDLQNQLGNSLILLGRYNEAGPYLKQSVKLAPNCWNCLDSLGIYYVHTGHIDYGIKELKTAMKINPGDFYSYLNIAQAYYFSNRLNEAREFLSSVVLVKYPQDVYFLTLDGSANYRLGNKKKGMDEVLKAYNLSKDQFYLNLYYMMQNNQDTSNIK